MLGARGQWSGVGVAWHACPRHGPAVSAPPGGFRVLGFWFRVSGVGFQVSGFGFWFSDLTV